MRLTRLAPVFPAVLLVLACAVAVAVSREADWSPPAAVVLLIALAFAADRFEIRTRSGTYVSGSMPAFVLAAVLLGPTPAALVGGVATLLHPRKDWKLWLGDFAAFVTFPLVAGLAARPVVDLYGAEQHWLGFVLVTAAVFQLAWTVNFLLIAAYMRIYRGRRMLVEVAASWRPLLGTQFAHALGTGGLAYLTARMGIAWILLAGAIIVTYSRLTTELLEAERVRDEAEERNAQLELANERLRRSHFGAMRSLVRSIHLHDRMTARHSAAVARYARQIAEAAGCSEHDQHLVHTAGLLHDVGKHIFTDEILKGDTKLDDEQWELVKRHPEEGARIVRLLEGHEDVAEIIHAHHERIDGRGYPRGLAGDEIPMLSRMISIADTYDVMTSRDSYREPVPPAEAVAELRRVAGAQLDAHLVEIFVTQVLPADGVMFGHADDADFEAELGEASVVAVMA